MTEGRSGSRDSIRDALQALPRVRAADDFTDRVAARWAATPPGGRRRPRSWPRLAAAAVLLAVVGAGVLHERGRLEARQRRAVLQQQQEELRRDLDRLRARAASPPTLYLGATADYDVVLDLGPWMEPGPQPAAYAGTPP
jgi:hypothetical protein